MYVCMLPVNRPRQFIVVPPVRTIRTKQWCRHDLRIKLKYFSLRRRSCASRSRAHTRTFRLPFSSARWLCVIGSCVMCKQKSRRVSAPSRTTSSLSLAHRCHMHMKHTHRLQSPIRNVTTAMQRAVYTCGQDARVVRASNCVFVYVRTSVQLKYIYTDKHKPTQTFSHIATQMHHMHTACMHACAILRAATRQLQLT